MKKEKEKMYRKYLGRDELHGIRISSPPPMGNYSEGGKANHSFQP